MIADDLFDLQNVVFVDLKDQRILRDLQEIPHQIAPVAFHDQHDLAAGRSDPFNELLFIRPVEFRKLLRVQVGGNMARLIGKAL